MHELRSTLVHGDQRSALVSKSQRGRAAGAGLTAISIRREEARQCNQRREDRHLNVVEKAVLRVNRRKFEVEVINVSSRGAMISADLELRIGAKVEIAFEGCNETQCFVRWVRGRRIGLEFAKETLIIAPSEVRRLIVSGRRCGEQENVVAIKKDRPARQHLLIKGLLHWQLGSLPITLRNISREGAMLDAKQDLSPETDVVLEVPGSAAVQARVVWSRSGHIGIRFGADFDLNALAQPEAAPQSPPMLKPDYLKDERDPNSPWAACWDRLSPDDL